MSVLTIKTLLTSIRWTNGPFEEAEFFLQRLDNEEIMVSRSRGPHVQQNVTSTSLFNQNKPELSSPVICLTHLLEYHLYVLAAKRSVFRNTD